MQNAIAERGGATSGGRTALAFCAGAAAAAVGLAGLAAAAAPGLVQDKLEGTMNWISAQMLVSDATAAGSLEQLADAPQAPAIVGTVLVLVLLGMKLWLASSLPRRSDR